MTVYAVMTGFYEQHTISEIFSSYELAREYCQNRMEHAYSGFDESKPAFYEIVMVQVDRIVRKTDTE
jgi:hypothetical protein